MIELQTQFEMQAKMLDEQAKMIAEIKRSQAPSPTAEPGAKESPEAQASGPPEVFAIDTRESLIGESLTMTAPPSASWHEQSDPQLTMERLAAQDVMPLPIVAFHGRRGRSLLRPSFFLERSGVGCCRCFVWRAPPGWKHISRHPGHIGRKISVHILE